MLWIIFCLTSWPTDASRGGYCCRKPSTRLDRLVPSDKWRIHWTHRSILNRHWNVDQMFIDLHWYWSNQILICSVLKSLKSPLFMVKSDLFCWENRMKNSGPVPSDPNNVDSKVMSAQSWTCRPRQGDVMIFMDGYVATCIHVYVFCSYLYCKCSFS
jgi:hypothetical protein